MLSSALACAPSEPPPQPADPPSAARPPADLPPADPPARAPEDDEATVTALPLAAAPLALAWEQADPSDAGWPMISRAGDGASAGILRIEDGAIVRRRADTGAVDWRVDQPDDIRWHELAPGPEFILATGSSTRAPDKTQLAGFAVAPGTEARLVWRQALDESIKLHRAPDGATVLERAPGCRTRAIDPSSGRSLAGDHEYRGLRFERRPLRGGRPHSSCRPAARPLARGLIRARGRSGLVRAESWSRGRVAWSEDFIHDMTFGADKHSWIAGRAHDGVALVGAGDVSRPRWRQRWTPDEACEGDELPTVRAAVVHARVYPLARQCGRARLYDPETGAPSWTRASPAIPLIEGESSGDGPLLLPSYRAIEVQWFSLDGQPGHLLKVAPGVREHYALPGGLLLVSDEGLRFEPSSQQGPRWSLALNRSNLASDGERWIVAQDRQEPRGQLLVDARAGAVVGSIANAYVIGFAGDYLILRRAEGSALLAVRLPE